MGELSDKSNEAKADEARAERAEAEGSETALFGDTLVSRRRLL